jgi:TonB family protein
MMKCAMALLLLATGTSARAGDEPVLLAGRVTDEAARNRLKAALADQHPAVRAAAVRVINVSGVGELVPVLVLALQTEADAITASEMIRFLASLNRPELDAAALDAARRLGPPVHAALADGLARRGGAAAAHIPALRSLGLDETSWGVFYGLASAGGGPGPLAAAILRERDPVPWRVLLASLRRTGTELDGGLAVAGVRSESAEIRTATYWHLAITFDPGKPPGETLAAALGESPEARAETAAAPETALAFELLQRLLGRPARPALETLKALGPTLPRLLPSGVVGAKRLVGALDKAEKRTLSTAYFHDPDALERWPSRPADREAKHAGPYARVETIRGLPAGYVPQVLAATACTPKKSGALLGGEVSYGADGRPRHVGLMPSESSKECLEAARVLLTATLAPLGIPTREGEKSLLLLPDRPEFLACVDDAARLPLDRARRVGTEEDQDASVHPFTPPRKIRNVPPQYPISAGHVRIGGLVLLEASVTPSGCVSGVSLLAGVDSRLDLEAIRAVSAWSYAPALLDGAPIPVSMTVSVVYNVH